MYNYTKKVNHKRQFENSMHKLTLKKRVGLCKGICQARKHTSQAF